MLKKNLVTSLLVLASTLGCDDPPACQGEHCAPKDPPEPTATWTGDPVSQFGQLQVVGNRLRNAQGEPVQLKGVSSMWLNWERDGYAESLESLRYMRDNWHLSIIRVAMGIEADDESPTYLKDPAEAERQVRKIVENAIELGVYVLIDWHDHEALSHQAEAEEFFSKMARDYGSTPNVLYETFNEPLQVSWAQLKPYHEAVLAKIREHDPDNVVIFGTPQWSQQVSAAARDPIDGINLMYTLHFYSCTHGASIRQPGVSALGAGAAVFVTEWGATHADGGRDGVVCEAETTPWLDWMKANQVSWTAWKLDGCSDSSCLLLQGAPVDGPWTDEYLQGHGPLVRDAILAE